MSTKSTQQRRVNFTENIVRVSSRRNLANELSEDNLNLLLEDEDGSVSHGSDRSQGGLNPSHRSNSMSLSRLPAFFSFRRTSSTSNSTRFRRQKEKRAVEGMSHEETKRVQVWRTVVLFLIVGAGVLVSVGTFFFLDNQEDDTYEDSYNLHVESMLDAATLQFNQNRMSIQAMAESMSATVLETNQRFPFTTIPMMEVDGHLARTKAAVEGLIYAPIVTSKLRDEWIKYTQSHYEAWMQQSQEIFLEQLEGNQGGSSTNTTWRFGDEPILEYIHYRDEDGNTVIDNGRGPFAPIWQTSPPPARPQEAINFNMFSLSYVREVAQLLTIARSGLFSTVEDFKELNLTAVDPTHEALTLYTQPVFDEVTGGNEPSSRIVGFLFAFISWNRFVAELLPAGVNGIYLILVNSCEQVFTFVFTDDEVRFLGEGDMHPRSYDSTKYIVPLVSKDIPKEVQQSKGHCVYELHVYASKEFEDGVTSRVPIVFTILTAILFLVVALTFFVYDRFVGRRNDKVVSAAAKSNALLATLFPSNVRERLFAADVEHDDKGKRDARGSPMTGNKTRLKSYLSVYGDLPHENVETGRSKPIAELFTETTILFSDIAGFTAWSSVREPSQVFTLLETLYHAFDQIAKKRRVFKVETVGDCYVAVTGLPEPQKDHAVIMARFARDCMVRMRYLTKKLEVTLGPDTGDLAMRMGMHSGPVTAGVLRAERSRFQLFGDSMNTASRMESTGERDRIQVSQETAECLIAAGKSEWIRKREEKVVAKGKGELQTYWLVLAEEKKDDEATWDNGEVVQETNEKEDVNGSVNSGRHTFDGKTARLIDWNVDVLVRLLKLIVVRRAASAEEDDCPPNEERYINAKNPVIEEVKEIITLPEFNANASQFQGEAETIQLEEVVVEQLHDFVCNIAAVYRDNPFHNFEHASHVTMSVVKLLSRIVAPSDLDFEEYDGRGKRRIASTLHDHTYGITSDPLTQFACVFSALIHDVDHAGVPNAQLVRERAGVALYYNDKSVAEQNSVDLAWNLLMDDAYADLRAIIYTTDTELQRFRQLVVNSVMATDIVDKELKTLRNQRWEKAFAESCHTTKETREDINRKATIVIEHLIQASDVAHTMQHWHIYRKWNARFFEECYDAYLAGRAEKDPAESWYNGELGFFDFYIIPLAKKLKDCGVFGVSSDEYLNYAIRNRKEWEERGREIVDEMIEHVTRPESKESAAPAMSTKLRPGPTKVSSTQRMTS